MKNSTFYYEGIPCGMRPVTWSMETQIFHKSGIVSVNRSKVFVTIKQNICYQKSNSSIFTSFEKKQPKKTLTGKKGQKLHKV